MAKYIFVVGGVMSGVGKGIASASIGKILQARGLRVTAVKIDPYINVDAGTMNPTEHGEVFVLDDGLECDQDMGNYERFLDTGLTRTNYMTTGSVYLSVIEKERSLKYGGKFVSVVPYIPLEVIEKIDRAAKENDAGIAITEIGGTVGEYENILFLEAIKMLKIKKPKDVVLVLVSYLPLQGSDSELKTKPTQHAVRALNSAGLHPDIIIARGKTAVDKVRKEKIAFHCNIKEEDVISAPDVESVYEVPLNFEKDNIGSSIIKKLGIKSRDKDLKDWEDFVNRIRTSKEEVKIGIVGKYFGTGSFVLADSYISVIESLKHAAYALGLKPLLEWLNAEDYDADLATDYRRNLERLSEYQGIVVPGGFGSRGVEGKIGAIKYLRENKIPFLGLCYGMQLAIIESMRAVKGYESAHTTEIDPATPHPVIDILPEQKKNITEKNYGATMRLGAYPAELKEGTIAEKAYGVKNISERHRHRYEVNPEYVETIEEKTGLIFSGVSPDRRLMEVVELSKSKHPFFLGTQFHPELKTRPLRPHPLFKAFVESANRFLGMKKE